jgi:uncharacterized protein
MKRGSAAFLCGVVFGAGLILGGMTQPAKVIGFLDFTGNWDASLAMVMIGAIGVHAIAYRLTMKRAAPVLADAFVIPTRNDLELNLIAGAALFGIGWGLGGFCPGPALTSIASGQLAPPLFVVGMMAGMIAHGAMQRRARAEPAAGAGLALRDTDV